MERREGDRKKREKEEEGVRRERATARAESVEAERAILDLPPRLSLSRRDVT